MLNFNIAKTVLLVLLVNTLPIVAQQDIEKTKISEKITLLFPDGKSKALLLSYDDGRREDRRLVALMNKYQLVGTFHLNSNKLDTVNYLTKGEIISLFNGHEVSVHTANHPNLPDISRAEVIHEIIEDRKELERLAGYPVRGMAYPFGNTNDDVVSTISTLGIEYARTVNDSYNFEIPKDFLKWHPTIHQFAKAYWEPNQPEIDKIEMGKFYTIIESFLESKELCVLDIWGHSWEMGNDVKKWEETEKFFQLLANHDNVYYTTQIKLVDYINAFRSLKFSVNKELVTNPSSQTVFIKINNQTISIPSGATVTLSY
jgi:peptidoglycan/xylan/chitin deacetylase (PgdA/CDA1 family)